MSLESLANPLERLTYLPTVLNYRVNTLAGGITWDATFQYYIGDVVTSIVDGYAYVYTAETTGRTSVVGGGDPSLSGDWVRLAGSGVTTYDNTTAAITGASAGAGGAYALVGASLSVPANSDWLVTFQGTVTTPLAQTSADVSTFTITGNGVGGTSGANTCSANDGSATSSFSFSTFVSVGTGGSTLTATGVALGQAANVSAGVLSAVRLG